MNLFQKKVASAIASGAMLLNLVVPALAQSTTLVITGNGADSENKTDVKVTTSTTVTQNNDANISNNVNSSANTGNNTASRNTGGDVYVGTGDATSVVSVANTANSNQADIDGCCGSDVEVLIGQNGADSKNDAKLKLENTVWVDQNNDASLQNNVTSNTNTGGNRTNRNTGGDVAIETGDALSAVSIENSANYNSARIGGGSGSSLSMWILENGADTKNKIDLKFENLLGVRQYNDANVSNKVNADAETGDNKANKNTGGEVFIGTGDAEVGVLVDNLVNFNWADVECDCLMDVLAKIAKNGDESKNEIKANLSDTRYVAQENDFSCGKGGYGLPSILSLLLGKKKSGGDCNDINAYAGTGDNTAKANTGEGDSDPAIETGNASVFVEVENTANSNEVGAGSGPSWEFPLPGGFSFNLNISFSLAQLLAALGL